MTLNGMLDPRHFAVFRYWRFCEMVDQPVTKSSSKCINNGYCYCPEEVFACCVKLFLNMCPNVIALLAMEICAFVFRTFLLCSTQSMWCMLACLGSGIIHRTCLAPCSHKASCIWLFATPASLVIS
jgi:hypothetical protein